MQRGRAQRVGGLKRVTALMPAPAAAALADMHSEPAAQPPRLGQLVLILVLGPLLLDLPAALAPRRMRRVELLINLLWRLTMTMPPVLLTRPTTGPTRTPRTLPARERRRLTLPSTPRLLQAGPPASPTRARSRSFSASSRETSPHNPSFSASSAEHRAANRASSSTGSAGSTSTSDSVTATTATQIRRRLHNPCSTR